MLCHTSPGLTPPAPPTAFRLQVPANAELRGHVLKHEIAAHVFVHMTSEQLASKVRPAQAWMDTVPGCRAMC